MLAIRPFEQCRSLKGLSIIRNSAQETVEHRQCQPCTLQHLSGRWPLPARSRTASGRCHQHDRKQQTPWRFGQVAQLVQVTILKHQVSQEAESIILPKRDSLRCKQRNKPADIWSNRVFSSTYYRRNATLSVTMQHVVSPRKCYMFRDSPSNEITVWPTFFPWLVVL